jgi:hypothetical protein
MTNAYQPADLLKRAKTAPMRNLLELLIMEGWRTEMFDRGPSFLHPLDGTEVPTPSYVPEKWWGSPTYTLHRRIAGVRLVAHRGDPDNLRIPFMLRRTGVPWADMTESVLSYKKAMIYVAEEFPGPS